MKLIEIFKTNYGESVREVGELAVDRLLEDKDILEKIPLLNLILATKNTIISIQDAFLIKKTITFLRTAEETSLEARVRFISENLNGKEVEFAEKVMHSITRLDDIEKSILIAKLYKACVYEKISLEEFYRLIRIVDLAYLADLKYILLIKDGKFRGVEAKNLSMFGITQQIFKHADLSGESKVEDMEFKLTTIGETLVDCL